MSNEWHCMVQNINASCPYCKEFYNSVRAEEEISIDKQYIPRVHVASEHELEKIKKEWKYGYKWVCWKGLSTTSSENSIDQDPDCPFAYIVDNDNNIITLPEAVEEINKRKS